MDFKISSLVDNSDSRISADNVQVSKFRGD